MPERSERPAPRDLLAERLRRLEGGVSALTREVAGTRARLSDATQRLDRLIDLVGRLGRVVDVQGSTLLGDENDLEQRVDALAERLSRVEEGREPQVADTLDSPENRPVPAVPGRSTLTRLPPPSRPRGGPAAPGSRRRD